MIDKFSLINRLDEMTSKVAEIALRKGNPLHISKKSTILGSLKIEKLNNGFYSIYSKYGKCLYTDIALFDIAVIVAQHHDKGQFSKVKDILDLELKFSKFHTDMLHYLHSMRSAKKNNDGIKFAILEDKFQMAEIQAKVIKDKILRFKK